MRAANRGRAGLSLLAALSTVAVHAAQSPPVAPDDGAIACSPVRAAVAVDESVALNVWMPAGSTASKREWDASAGRIAWRNGAHHWDFHGTDAGYHTATLRVVEPSGRVRTCSIVVRVRLRGRGAPLISGRTLLLRDEKEDEGYGLYTYLLFGSRPSGVMRERFSAALDAYLDVIPPIEAFQQGLPLGRRNVTVLPVDEQFSEDTRSDRTALKAWLLDHYDYARAREILRPVPGAVRDGPYFLSCSSPEVGRGLAQGQCLFQSLASVPPHLIALWTKEFLNQAEQAQFSGLTLQPAFLLRLRTTIGILAVGVPEVKGQLDELIRWWQKRPGPPAR